MSLTPAIKSAAELLWTRAAWTISKNAHLKTLCKVRLFQMLQPAGSWHMLAQQLTLFLLCCSS